MPLLRRDWHGVPPAWHSVQTRTPHPPVCLLPHAVQQNPGIIGVSALLKRLAAPGITKSNLTGQTSACGKGDLAGQLRCACWVDFAAPDLLWLPGTALRVASCVHQQIAFLDVVD